MNTIHEALIQRTSVLNTRMDDLEEGYEAQESRLNCCLKDTIEEVRMDFRSITEEAVEKEVFKSRSLFIDELKETKVNTERDEERERENETCRERERERDPMTKRAENRTPTPTRTTPETAIY